MLSTEDGSFTHEDPYRAHQVCREMMHQRCRVVEASEYQIMQ